MDTTETSQPRVPAGGRSASQTTPAPEGAARQWISPGVSVRKRWLTGIGVALAAAVFLWIAASEGASMLVSTIIGVVFLGCFVWYLRIVAPTPFTLTLDAAGIARAERGGEPVAIPWPQVAKVKEEVFKNGTSISVTVYKRVGERGLHRAWVVYRDDIPNFDTFASAVQAALPEGTPWIREQVHE
jgi:type IV secretory pathway TrbF-like protein